MQCILFFCFVFSLHNTHVVTVILSAFHLNGLAILHKISAVSSNSDSVYLLDCSAFVCHWLSSFFVVNKCLFEQINVLIHLSLFLVVEQSLEVKYPLSNFLLFSVLFWSSDLVLVCLFADVFATNGMFCECARISRNLSCWEKLSS